MLGYGSKKNRNERMLNILIGIFLALLISELIYQQPSFEDSITSSKFLVITKDGKCLGYAYSTLFIKYNANPWGTSLGDFSFPIRTQLVETPAEIRSVLLKDVAYEVSLWRNDKLIESQESCYLGSINIEEETDVIFNVLFLAKTEHPMTELVGVFGPIKIRVTGRYYNNTSGETISSGQIYLPIFILYPNTKLATFCILFITIFIKLLIIR